jgi:UDP-glucose-4-epimerase GalE
MRILITGGAGYIGSHTARRIQAAGYIPVVLDDLSMGHRELARFGPFEYGSVLDETRLVEILRAYSIEAVIHFAAKALVPESVQWPERYFQTNVGGMATLLAAMRLAGVRRLVFSSSAAVYGKGTGLPFKEGDTPVPANAYGQSKLLAEQMLAAAAPALGLRWAVLRYFNVVGCDPESGLWEWHEPESHVVPNLLNAALQGRPFHVFGDDYPTPDGTAVRDYVDVRDLASIHLEALEALDDVPSFLSNVGSGRGCSVRQLAETAQQVWRRPIEVKAAPRRSGDPAFLVADNTFLLQWSRTAQHGLRPLTDSLAAVIQGQVPFAQR